MKVRILLATAAMGLTATLGSSPAQAQATRTWVSGVGDDANPCSRTAPCKTFAGAISKTATGGEINCLDPGGFGTLNITKSITIDCAGTLGGVLAANTNGFIVNGANVNVILRNIIVNSANTTTGNGIRFILGASLVVDNLVIENFAGTSTNGAGIRFEPSSAAELYVSNTRITNNAGGGILIRPTGAGGSARVTIDNAEIANSGAGDSIRFDATQATSGIGLIGDVSDSRLTGGSNGLSAFTSVGSSSATVTVTGSQIFNNQPGSGLLASGGSSLIRASGNTITANGAAVSPAAGGSVRSYGDNIIDGNTNPSTFTPPDLVKL